MNSIAECGPILGSRQLVPTFRARIIESHEKSKASDERLRKELLENINLKRATAVLLSSAERDLDNPQWRKLKKELPFDGDAIKSYFTLLHRFPEPADDLQTALLSIRKSLEVTMALPVSDSYERGKLHEPSNFFTQTTLAAIRLAAEFRKYIARYPVKNWERQTAELFVRSLQPVINCHQQVASWLKSTQC